ncbi:MAG TPA: hypothetical protein VJZ01_10290 [Lachnospiraceae bacterium]|nr:hypothetical protein [Lachnospiraceae bacterium]
MALFDWNGDGKKDIYDNLIEYQVYKNSTKKSSNKDYSSSSDGNMSTLGAAGSVFGGLVVTSLLFSGVNLDQVPAFILIVIWIVATAVIAAIVSTFKR